MFFNNCRLRPHAELYGSGAFYDLNTFGGQARMATDLRPGQHCCVATPSENGEIEFAWYRFIEERRQPDPHDPSVEGRVFYGEQLGDETLSREEATATEPYAFFFNVNGHFKRLSALRPRGACVVPADLTRTRQ